MQNFFFTISNGKFLRVDLEKIICVVVIKDRVQVHTADDIYEPRVKMEKIREVLPEERFNWISQFIAVGREI